jgi:hypothetical protein
MPRSLSYKPLLFTTTLRNPERLKYFIKILNNYENKKLTNQLAIKIVQDCIKEKIYRPDKSFRMHPELKRIYNSNEPFTADQAQKLIEASEQDHKEAGFDEGWASRFHTIFGICREFGFAWYQAPLVNEELIKISSLGKKLIEDIIFEDIPEPWKDDVISDNEQFIFTHALTKYQRNNPFRRVLNEVKPLSLLLRTIKLLNADSEIASAGISKKELPLLLFWKNNDAKQLYLEIKNIRQKYKTNPSDEIILEVCDKLNDGKRFNSFQDTTIMNDLPDDFIRKMRITGLLSFRGGGRFLDINLNRTNLVEHIINNYSKCEVFNSEEKYYKTISEEDNFLLNYNSTIQEVASEGQLNTWINKFGWETIKEELKILAEKRSTSNEELKPIPGYVRLEFLTALAIKAKCNNTKVIPNYKSDDEGKPYHQAPGRRFDIECEENNVKYFIEVTLIDNSDQVVKETNKIERKISDYLNGQKMELLTHFVAPRIHADTANYCDWLRDSRKINVTSNKIIDFVNKIETYNSLSKVN